MLNRLLTVLSLVLWALPAVAQDVDTAWVRTYNGPGNDNDGANAIGLDTAGNVYVTGASWGSGTNYDLATIKYDQDGTQCWVSRYDGPANGPDDAHALALDDSGNVCVTGPVLAGLPTNYDYATIKYGSSYGTQLWFKGLGAGGTDAAEDIGIDGSGSFYVTGYCYTSPTWYLDYMTVKYASDGTPLWSRNFNGPASGDDSASAIAVTSSGDVYVTGQTKVASMTRGYGTVKYNSSGNPIWSRLYVGPGGVTGYALAIAAEGSGNVYVTGKSLGAGTGFDYATIKYDPTGTQLWVQRYNGPGNSHDEAYAIAVDGFGNVYLTGFSAGSGTSADYATVKYDPAGTELWVQRYNGPGNSTDKATALALDGSGNVYVTGWSIQSGPDYYFDIATIKYDPDGTLLWEKRHNGPANISDGGNAIEVDNSGNVYVTGYCDHGYGSGDYATIKYWQNYPPDPFSLLSPEDEASLPPGYVDFDWEDAADPDPWDEVRYDLYVSTSQVFHPDSTVVYDSLLASEQSDDFELGTHYWKVRAYDNHAEVWSGEIWSFVISSPTGLVGYWKFDEGTGDIAYDVSGYENHGALMNEPTWADGLPLLSKALDFDGENDYVEIPDDLSLDISGPFTISAWIYPRSFPDWSAWDFASFVNKWMNYILQTGEFGPRRLRMIFRDAQGESYVLESPDNTLTLDEWQHVAGLWDGDSLKLFRSGQQVASAYAGPVAPNPTSNPLYISTESTSWQFFDGLIDEVKVYSRALSPEEIGVEFESGFIRGDANGDGIVNIGDVVYLVSYLYKSGPAPDPLEAGDCNCDGVVNLGDVVYLVSYLYKNGPPPSC
jgi:hypothetical protein